MQKPYMTIASSAIYELIEKKSRFIAEARPVKTDEDCAAFVAQTKAKHRDARHHCFGWVLKNGVVRYGDDGEPQGSAGMPILEVIKREELFDIAVIVTRYFGGILLGTGGLSRAYSSSAKGAIEAAQKLYLSPCNRIMLTTSYQLYDRLVVLVGAIGGEITKTDFAENVTLQLRIKTELSDELCKKITELSADKIKPIICGEEFAAVEVD